MKGIEWIKLNTGMCEDETMRLIDSMELRDPAHYLWIRLLLQAGKTNDNGLVYLKKGVPYTKAMLSVLFNRPIDIIEKVLDILESFKMIEIYEDNIIKICNWEKHQNIEGMKRIREGNRKRVKDFRERKKQENERLENENLDNKDVLDNSADNSNDAIKINKNKNCNANVTLKKEKIEKDNKNKIKNIDKEEREEELNAQALKIIQALEKINVSIKGLTEGGLAKLLTIHEEKYIKLATGKAIERNKLDINYINGILKNWLKEGYPKTYEDMEFEDCEEYNLSSAKEKPKLRFINFEPRKYDYNDLENKLLRWEKE
jgi:predicted phage replisome organizer